MSLGVLVNVSLSKPLPSLANSRLHWRAKASLVKAQRQRLALYLRLAREVPNMRRVLERDGDTGITCTLTRIATRRLDSDNLQGAFKAIRDQVAAELGLDDGSWRWTWKYAQESGPPGYRVELEVTKLKHAYGSWPRNLLPSK